MSIRIVVNGAKGKMGTLACETLKKHPHFQVVGELTRGDSLAEALKTLNPQVVLELTNAESVFENSLTIIQQSIHPVIGATGLNPEQIKTLTTLSQEKHLGGLIVPNFSISALLMMQFAATAAKYFPEVEIIEAHHQQKLDAPSGTAIKTADMIANARKEKKNTLTMKSCLPGARGATYQDINIHSIRLPGILARQQVIFGNMGETLSITHDSIDRQSFMPGVILACQRVLELKTLAYGLEHVLT